MRSGQRGRQKEAPGRGSHRPQTAGEHDGQACSCALPGRRACCGAQAAARGREREHTKGTTCGDWLLPPAVPFFQDLRRGGVLGRRQVRAAACAPLAAQHPARPPLAQRRRGARRRQGRPESRPRGSTRAHASPRGTLTLKSYHQPRARTSTAASSSRFSGATPAITRRSFCREPLTSHYS